MNIIKMFLFSFCVFSLSLVVSGNNLVFADDDFNERYEYYDVGHHGDHHEDEPLEEIGKTLGWGTVIAMGIAGIFYPIRRTMKGIITNYPEMKNPLITLSKFLGKHHVLIGIIAVVLSVIHGVFLYLSEGRLESEGVVGLGAGLFMLIAGLLGLFLLKNKKVKSLRLSHTVMIGIAFLIGVVHIFTS